MVVVAGRAVCAGAGRAVCAGAEGGSGDGW